MSEKRAVVAGGACMMLAAAASPPPAAAPALAAGPVGRDTVSCELRLEPAEVPVREAAVLVSVGASDDPGSLRGVEVPARSGVKVLAAAPAPNDDEVVVRMALDTSAAEPGEWPIFLRGGTADCRGTLVVPDEPEREHGDGAAAWAGAGDRVEAG